MDIETIKLIGYIALIVGGIAISLQAILLKIRKRKFHPIRQNTIKYLQKLRIIYNPTLPMFANENCIIKSAEEVVKRALALSICVSYGSDYLNTALTQEEKNASRLEHIKKITQFDLKKTFTPKEKQLFTKPTQQLLIDISWQSECLPHLAYALGLIDFPPYPDVQRDWSPLVEVFLKKNNADEILKQAKPISKTAILQSLDMFFCLQWACNEYIIKGRKVKFANEEVVREQFKTNIWLVSDEEDWDDIDTSA